VIWTKELQKSRTILNGEGLFELKERKRLAMSTQMRRRGGVI
jgi:hypothetical protein